MDTEVIKVSPTFSCPLSEVIIPDIRYIGLMVSRNKQKVIEAVHTAAHRIYDIISRRDFNDGKLTEFTVDVPDFSILKDLMPAERDELATFTEIFRALVEHLLIDVQMTGYSLSNHTPAGVRYYGWAWVTK